MVTAKTTPTGGPEAEALFQKGLSYELSGNGDSYDPDVAKELYILALNKGSAKAALKLGRQIKRRATGSCKKADDLGHMVRYFVQAAKMGSPDALYCLHEACSRGLGVPKDSVKAAKLLEGAAQGGSPLGMTRLGLDRIGRDRLNEGKIWLTKALSEGYGDAGYHLASLYYAVERDVESMIRYLREGAEKGSEKCIRRLVMIYEQGQFGQEVNLPLAEEYLALLPANKAGVSRRAASSESVPEAKPGTFMQKTTNLASAALRLTSTLAMSAMNW